MSIRRAASWAQPRQESSVPRGARTTRGPAPAGARADTAPALDALSVTVMAGWYAARSFAQPHDHLFPVPLVTERGDGHDRVALGEADVVGVDAAGAGR